MLSTMAEMKEQLVYVRGTCVAVPHYKRARMFVLPGGKSYTDAQLKKFGFVPASLKLWERDNDL